MKFINEILIECVTNIFIHWISQHIGVGIEHEKYYVAKRYIRTWYIGKWMCMFWNERKLGWNGNEQGEMTVIIEGDLYNGIRTKKFVTSWNWKGIHLCTYTRVRLFMVVTIPINPKPENAKQATQKRMLFYAMEKLSRCDVREYGSRTNSVCGWRTHHIVALAFVYLILVFRIRIFCTNIL